MCIMNIFMEDFPKVQNYGVWNNDLNSMSTSGSLRYILLVELLRSIPIAAWDGQRCRDDHQTH